MASLIHRFLFPRHQVPEGYSPLEPQVHKAYNRFRPHGAKPFFCYVPFTSLTFSFSGQVFACSYNRRVLLGRYPKNSIREIWESAEALKLREHMRYNDLNYGCEHCKYFVDRGKFSNLKPLVFDRYAKKYQEKYPLVMEFELSNTCNLECQMCTGEVSSSIRKNRDKLPPIHSPYDDAFLEQLREFIPYMEEAKFYGGEPFLIPIYFKIWESIHALKPDMRLFVITNGSTWNEKVKATLERGHFDVAVSIDALDKQKLEKIRKNIVLETLQENIARFNEYCRRKGTYLSLSFTVQKENWDELPRMINYCNSLQAHIFVSYLETPVHFSVADLPVEELRHMRAELAKFTFPSAKLYEANNNRCYNDFLHYLDGHIADAESKTYVEYRYGYANTGNNGQPVEYKPLREIRRRPHARETWEKNLRTYLGMENENAELPEFTRLSSRLEVLRNGLPATEQHNLDLLLADEAPEIWVENMRKETDEELAWQIRRAFNFIKFTE